MPSVHEIAKEFTMDSARMLCKDAGYIPEERLDWSPMDCANSAIAILTACADTNFEMAAAMKGGAVEKLPEGLDFQALKDRLMESAQAVCDAIDSLSDADLEGETQMPWGIAFPTSQAIFLPASHMSYHDGQINYIQLLLGDTKFHWMEA